MATRRVELKRVLTDDDVKALAPDRRHKTWSVAPLPIDGAASRTRARLFGLDYIRYDLSQGTTTEYWYVPKRDGDICLCFVTDDPGLKRRFLNDLAYLAELDDIAGEPYAIEVGPGETWWRCENGLYMGPRTETLWKKGIKRRLRKVRTEAGAYKVVLEWYVVDGEEFITIPDELVVEDTSVEDLIAGASVGSGSVEWQILPPDHALNLMRTGEKTGQEEKKGKRPVFDTVRLCLLTSLRPKKWWYGRHIEGAAEYVVLEFDTCVIAECPIYGNALYIWVLRKGALDWREVFCLTRREIRELGGIRVTHHERWFEVVQDYVTGELP